jgi:hypothetical protein
VWRELREVGATSLHAIAAELNRRAIQTPRRTGEWKAGSVAQLPARTLNAREFEDQAPGPLFV